MSKIKYFVQQSWLLIAASFLFGLLIAVTNATLSERIIQNEIDKLNNKMAKLITDANSFEKAIEAVQIPGKKGKIIETDIYKGVDSGGVAVGFAFVGVGSGFADKIKLVIAVDGSCEKFLGYEVLASNETPGFGDKIKEDFLSNQFKGAPVEQMQLFKVGNVGDIDSEIIAITGATVSSEAVVKIFNSHIDSIKEALKTKGLIK